MKNHNNKKPLTAKQMIKAFQPPSEEERLKIIQPIVQRKIDFYKSTFGNNGLLSLDYLEQLLIHYEDHGWAIASKLIPHQMCENLLTQINEKLVLQSGFDMDKPSTWNQFPFGLNGFVELYHLPAQYEMRFYEPMYQLFSTLYEDEKLQVLLDRNCVKRSCHRPNSDQDFNDFRKGERKTCPTTMNPHWQSRGFWHHDMNLITGETQNPVQCVIAIDDTDESQGGFQCLDRFHWYAKEWAQATESYRNRMSVPNQKLPVFMPNAEEWVQKCGCYPEMRKGDVMVWKSEVCHGGGFNENKNGMLRLATYVNYVPKSQISHPKQLEQIVCYETGSHPGNTACNNTWEQLEKDNHTPHPLTELGERLIGVSTYE